MNGPRRAEVMGFFGAALLLLFYSLKNNSKGVTKDIAIKETSQKKYKAGKITIRTPHGNPLGQLPHQLLFFYAR